MNKYLNVHLNGRKKHLFSCNALVGNIILKLLIQQNRIVVIKCILTMADTPTTSISKKFHEWLKSKGGKGSVYVEKDIIKRIPKPSALQELGVHAEAIEEKN